MINSSFYDKIYFIGLTPDPNITYFSIKLNFNGFSEFFEKISITFAGNYASRA